MDPPELSHELGTALGLSFPLLGDVDLAVIRAYGLEDAANGIAWPAIYVLDRAGTVRFRSLTENYRIREDARVVEGAIP